MKSRYKRIKKVKLVSPIIHKKRAYKVLKKKKFQKQVRSLLSIGLIICFSVSSIIALAFIDYMQKRIKSTPAAVDIFSEVRLATEIYDRNGTKLYRLYADDSNRDNIDQSEITNMIRAAYLAAEDSHFYQHGGINTEAIARCTVNTLSSEKVCGGSTITQQVVKIITQKSQRSVDRKVEEIVTAYKLEETYTKEEILQKYLNVTPYGSNITGIKTAARFYFGITDPKALTLAQAVTLASIINDPVDLAPTISSDPETAKKKLKEREEYVYNQLSLKLEIINEQLREYGDDLITPDMITVARSVEHNFKSPIFSEIKAGHFVNYTLNELQKRPYKYGIEPFDLRDLQTGGYRIYTSLDYNLQLVAERYALHAGNAYNYWNVYNAALMTIKPSTGEILTMAGSKSFIGQSEGCDITGRNCKYDPEVNVLTSLQSPGSTNKPLGYYLAYKDSILYPGSFLPDIPIKFGDYVPKNWDGKFQGVYNATARNMLRNSRNIPALIVVSLVGVDNYLNTARTFGYTTYGDNSTYGPSVILGGADVYPIEHAQAYGVFANGGDLVKVNPILRIEDSNGKIVYQANPTKERVADPAAVFLLNQTLLRLDTGIGETIGWDDREISGKTGTTENNKDSLLVVYSPDFVTIGWAGNNNNEILDQNYGWPAFVVAPWLRGYMAEIGNTGYFSAKTPFTPPEGVYWGGGECYNGYCRGIAQDWIISGREPAPGDVMIGPKGRYYQMKTAELQGYLNSYFSGIQIR